MPIRSLPLSAYTTVNALGRGVEASLSALRRSEGGLRRCDFPAARMDTWIGRVDGLEDEPLTGEWAAFDCRNNRLARAGLTQDGFTAAVESARDRLGAERIGVFIGTSTAGVQQTELAYQRRDPASGRLPADFDYRHTHNVFSVTDFTRHFLGLAGPAVTVSTACSSSAKVFASAYRHLRAGLCDAAVVGGVDSLCLTTLLGFQSLQLVSSRPCRPWDIDRDGLNIGEAAGFALLEWEPPAASGIALVGYGESSDAYHMSSPHPEGQGAARAMRQALASAELDPTRVDYINLHGTATPANDAAEDQAVLSVFGATTPCGSTKGWTGHTLGAAGIVEAVFACLCIEHGLVPATLNTERPDPRLNANLVRATRHQAARVVMSNAFGFGGTNCSLLFGSTRG